MYLLHICTDCSFHCELNTLRISWGRFFISLRKLKISTPSWEASSWEDESALAARGGGGAAGQLLNHVAQRINEAYLVSSGILCVHLFIYFFTFHWIPDHFLILMRTWSLSDFLSFLINQRFECKLIHALSHGIRTAEVFRTLVITFKESANYKV